MVLFLLLWLSTFAYSQGSIWDNITVNIAVVEYKPVTKPHLTVHDSVVLNTIEYQNVMLNTESNLDLVLFPEATLGNDPNTAVEVKINTNCDQKTQCLSPLEGISSMARIYQTYVVINLVEKEKCKDSDKSENCKNHGFHFYNTDVVFDRNGTIINKYRKYNLFGEYSLDKPTKPEQVIIETDFGAKLGIFTCFDILFKSPTQDLVGKIDGALFPTMWFSELPFLTAVQTQQMWAHAHNVALFAAGANNPAVGSGGTGVYLGSKGAFLGGIVAEGGTKTFIYPNDKKNSSTVQEIDDLAAKMDGFKLKTDPSVTEYKSFILNTSVTDYQGQLCFDNENTTENICCTYSLKLSSRKPKSDFNFYTYHLVAYTGVRTFSGVYNGGVEACAIIACLDSSLSSCGKRFPSYKSIDWPLTFEEVTVTATFTQNENKTHYPNSVLSSILPIDAEKTVWTVGKVNDKGKVEATFSVKEKQERLLTFGIYGRNFALDFDPNEDNNDDDGNSASLSKVSYCALLTCLLLSSFLMK